jgi:DNA repair exonuclease SbcCD ATPase subunit
MISTIQKVQSRISLLEEQQKKLLTEVDELKAAMSFVDYVKQDHIITTLKSVVDIVNNILIKVFDETYHFDLDIDLTGTKPRITPKIKKPEGTFPILTVGGGLLELISLFVRIALVIISKRKLLVLDEPFRFLDAQKKELVMEILSTLDFQIIMVTHDLQLVEKFRDRCTIVRIGG